MRVCGVSVLASSLKSLLCNASTVLQLIPTVLNVMEYHTDFPAGHLVPSEGRFIFGSPHNHVGLYLHQDEDKSRTN